MIMFFMAAYVLNEQEQDYQSRIDRRRLRDHSNPLSAPDSTFVSNYRLNKYAFLEVLNEVKSFVKETSIPILLKLAASLRFFAEGSYQRSVGKDTDIAMGRSTVSKILSEMINALENVLCPKWIKLKMSEEDSRKSKLHFVEKFGIPGVIGCIDGTHVALIKPFENEHLFFNRKGFFSINAMIICDFDMIIRAVDATRPGASHDAFVFSMSSAKHYYLSQYEAGDRGSWLLGDSGFGIEPFLLTPYRNPRPRSAEHRFNQQHAKARNIVERVIGVLKSRFRCLKTTLPYTPQKVVKIINVCCALHNICRSNQIDDIETETVLENNPIDEEIAENEENSSLYSVGRNIRDSIARNLIL